MLRRFIIGISVLVFVAAGYIIFRALSLSSPEVQETVVQQVNGTPQVASPMMEEMQARISELEEQIAEGRAKKVARSIAVLHGDDGFGSGELELGGRTRSVIASLVPQILADSDLRVVVAGHTDDRVVRASSKARFADNMELSFLRAKAVALEISRAGVPMDRIEVVGFGETRPIASNDTGEGRAMNRRVEIILEPNMGEE